MIPFFAFNCLSYHATTTTAAAAADTTTTTVHILLTFIEHFLCDWQFYIYYLI